MKFRFNSIKITWFTLLVILPFASHTSDNFKGSCPADPPPVDCGISSQFNPGRIAFTQLTGSYLLGGEENNATPEIDGAFIFNISGDLQVDIVGGNAENYLEIECDGSVTGQGKDKISGTITKTFSSHSDCGLSGNQMNWDVEIERTYSIIGNVTNTGEVELELAIDTATIDLLPGSNFLHAEFQVRSILGDCDWGNNLVSFTDIDVSGYTENIKLTDANYDPLTSSNWNPEYEVLDSKPWLIEMGSHLELNHASQANTINPVLVTTIPTDPRVNDMFFLDTVTADLTADFLSDIKTPIITDLILDEEKHYLLDVAANTSVKVNVDWKQSDETRQIEFTYGSTIETVNATGDETTWFFDAGEAGTSIKAKAISPSGESSEWEINTNKIVVPTWAGTASDWIATSGVVYNATLDWPISLETTRTVNTISLLTGFWGISGSVSSEFNAIANSDGSEANGDLTTDAQLKLADKEFEFNLEGSNYTTLTCDDMTTNGDATADLAGISWKKNMSPLTLIPGLQSAACGLSNSLCDLMDSFGIKGEAGIGLSGDGTFASDDTDIKWDSGSLTGELYAKISVKVIPKPLSSLAQVKLEGGGAGCLGFQFHPDFAIDKLGGEVNVGAKVSFLGLSANPSKEWPFGDACTTKIQPIDQGFQGWVPADGQLAMAASQQYGAAAWSELPLGQNRPSGDIKFRIWDGINWGDIIDLTNDADADMAPSIEFDKAGNLLIVYQRSITTLPTSVNDLDDFANGLELHYAVYDPKTSLLITTGQITTNNINDFGPVIKTDKDNELHLFWQTANGSHIFGDAINPVSINSSSWDSENSTWTSEQIVANNLSHTLGWSAASFNDDTMLVTLLLDTDQDFSSSSDRELFQISKNQGIWNAPVQLTNNVIGDDSPISTFSTTGEPMILWRQAEQVMQLRGDLMATPTLAFTSHDPLIDEGIGLEFGEGIVLSTNFGSRTFWSNSTTIELSSLIEQGNWTHLDQIIPDDGAQSILNTKVIGSNVILAYSSRLFENSNANLSDFVTPSFKTITLIPGFIFSDDFE